MRLARAIASLIVIAALLALPALAMATPSGLVCVTVPEAPPVLGVADAPPAPGAPAPEPAYACFSDPLSDECRMRDPAAPGPAGVRALFPLDHLAAVVPALPELPAPEGVTAAPTQARASLRPGHARRIDRPPESPSSSSS